MTNKSLLYISQYLPNLKQGKFHFGKNITDYGFSYLCNINKLKSIVIYAFDGIRITMKGILNLVINNKSIKSIYITMTKSIYITMTNEEMDNINKDKKTIEKINKLMKSRSGEFR